MNTLYITQSWIYTCRQSNPHSRKAQAHRPSCSHEVHLKAQDSQQGASGSIPHHTLSTSNTSPPECPTGSSERSSTSPYSPIPISSSCKFGHALHSSYHNVLMSSMLDSYDVMQTPDSIVMVMEYLEGELFDYIVKRGRVSLFSSFRISTAS